MAVRATLTSRETAQLLGVSEASVKRWADGGLLPAEKTAGGHRRFRPEDVAAARRSGLGQGSDAALNELRAAERSLPSAVSPEIAAAQNAALRASLFEALVGGRAAEASGLLVNLYLQGGTVGFIADTALCPALSRVGELWRRGELSIAEEHLATRMALASLQALRAALAAPDRRASAVICCSVEDDFHELPVHIAALVFEARGWEAVNLGANAPFFALAEAVVRFKPRVVCVASTVLLQPDRAAHEYAEFHAAAQRGGARIVLGGAGFAGEDARRRFPADLRAGSFSELEAFALTLERSGGAE